MISVLRSDLCSEEWLFIALPFSLICPLKLVFAKVLASVLALLYSHAISIVDNLLLIEQSTQANLTMFIRLCRGSIGSWTFINQCWNSHTRYSLVQRFFLYKTSFWLFASMFGPCSHSMVRSGLMWLISKDFWPLILWWNPLSGCCLQSPPVRRPVTSWDLNLVLPVLQKPAFEPTREISRSTFTHKVVCCVAISSVRQELSAPFLDSLFLRSKAYFLPKVGSH